MTLAELLIVLRDRRVTLSATPDGRLKGDAPAGAMTPEIRDAIAAHKSALIAHLAHTSITDTAAHAGIAAQPRQAEGLPLAPAQYRLWLLDQLEGGSARYNLITASRVVGRLDVEWVRRTCASIAERHELLRTAFVATNDGTPRQVAMAHVSIPVVIDAPVRDEDEQGAVARIVEEESRVRFDLARPPLMRVRVLQIAPDRHVLVLNQHHIITDVWSMDVFAREFVAIYHALASGADRQFPALAPLAVQYADYAVWQHAQQAGDRAARSLEFWRQELAGLPEVLDLPLDHPRPATLSYRGGAVPIRLDAPLVERLTRIARGENASLFMLLHTALCVVLAQMSAQDDFAIGVPATNRPRPELENLIGFFINTLVLRTQIGADETLRSLLARNRETMLRALAHQDTPFEKLVEALQVTRDLSYSPLTQVMFSFMNRPASPSAPQDALPFVVSPVPLPQAHALVELDWQLRETDDGVSGFLIYARDLFDEATAHQFVALFMRVLDCACADLSTPIASLELLSDDDRAALARWNDTATTPPPFDTVHAWLTAASAERPDAVAVTGIGGSLTYRALAARAGAIAGDLRRIGVGPGALVGVCLDRTEEVPAVLAGILNAGAGYVPLDPSFPPDRLAAMLAAAHAALVVVDASASEDVRAALSMHAPVVQLGALPSAPPLTHVPQPVPPGTMYVIFTSGSTGVPKGVIVPHRAAVNFLQAMQVAPGLTAADVVLAVTTLSFDIAVLEIFLPLVTGARLVIASRAQAADPDALMRMISTERITLMQATPATWRMLIAADWTGAPALTALCGGEALTSDLSHALHCRVATLWNMYGPTETTVWSSMRRIETPATAGVEPIGQPIANTGLHIVMTRPNARPDLARAPIGAAGELCISGAGLATGYLDQPALTAERFVPCAYGGDGHTTMYRTGDRARRRRDGTVEWLGRLDTQVKLRGFRIELGEIEAVLARHPSVHTAAVVIRTDDRDARLVAYVTRRNSTGSADEWRAWLRASLPEYMMPSAFVEMAALPLTPNGKVDRRALPAPVAPTDARSTDRFTPLEEDVAAIWRDVLRVPQPHLDDNFFDLGGHSLLLIQTHRQLTTRLGAACEVLDLFRYPTIRQQAALIAGRHDTQDVRGAARAAAAKQQDALARRRAIMARGRA